MVTSGAAEGPGQTPVSKLKALQQVGQGRKAIFMQLYPRRTCRCKYIGQGSSLQAARSCDEGPVVCACVYLIVPNCNRMVLEHSLPRQSCAVCDRSALHALLPVLKHFAVQILVQLCNSFVR